MPITRQCPHCRTAREAHPNHDHPYKIKEYGARRCTCGSVHWVLSAGGSVPLAVKCERCGRRNYSASAYEQGREDMRREQGSDPAPSKDPPF
jgi:phage FluMu protein Com